MASNSLICAHDNVFNKSILNKDGYYFNSSSEITEFINLIRKDKNKKDKLMSNRDKIKTIYSWDRIINSYNNFFKRISIDDNL